MKKQLKTCNKCKIKKELSQFSPHKAGKHGLNPRCRSCRNIEAKQYRKNNTIKLREKDKQRNKVRAEYRKKYMKEYVKNNKEELAKKKKEYYKNNKEKLDEKRKGRSDQIKKYYMDNREKFLEYSKNKRKNNEQFRERSRKYRHNYYVANKEYETFTTKQWRKNNPEKVKVYDHNRRSREIKAPGIITEWTEQFLWATQNGTCFYCSVALSNIRKDKEHYHLEHLTPLSRGGTNYISNLVLSCPTCNLRKNYKTKEEFSEYLEHLIY